MLNLDPTFLFDEESHTYWLHDRRLPSCTEILRTGGAYGAAFDHVGEYPVIRGQYVHKAIDLMYRGELDVSTVEDRLLPYVRAEAQWIANTGFVCRYSELALYNSVLLYGCRVDRIGLIGETWVVIDDKTGSINPAYHQQLMANFMAAKCWLPVVACFHKRLTSRGKAYLSPVEDPLGAWEKFVTLLCEWKRRNGNG